MMSLTITGVPATHVVFTSDSGSLVGYVKSGGVWVLENTMNGSSGPNPRKMVEDLRRARGVVESVRGA